LKRICGQEIRTIDEIEKDKAEDEIVKIKESKSEIPIA
jgi:hypothetical protein